MPTVYYAIGDIHGEALRLTRLHRQLKDDWHRNHGADKVCVVHLGDFIDRGPDSAGVIECVHSLAEEGWCEVLNLRGNHEQMMVDALATEHPLARMNWLRNGGQETLSSYEGDREPLLRRHVDWMRALPTMVVDGDAGVVFVHAGIDPDKFPMCEDAVHMWTRTSQFFESTSWDNPSLENMLVVHGHTPTVDAQPDVSDDGRRLNLDTGAVYGGALSAAAIVGGKVAQFFHA